MFKDQLDDERKSTANTSHAVLFSQQQELFYMHYSTDRIIHTIDFVIPLVENFVLGCR